MSPLMWAVWAALFGLGAGLAWVGVRDADPVPSAAGTVLLLTASGFAALALLPP